MNLKRLTLFLPTLLFSLKLFSQISTGGMPVSFTYSESNARIKMTAVPEVQLAEPDMEKIRQEDAENDQKPNVPWRFGIAREVNLGLNNAGTWDTLVDGSRIWRLRLSSEGAKSINLNYDLFYMPEGGKMFVYNSKKNILGAFTSINNKMDSAFATLPVRGDEIIVEYFEPSNKLGEGKLHIKQLVHGYRDVLAGDKAFNSSGACNVNINCALAENWQDEKRAVARITTNNNTTVCSGTLLNNVRQDGKPYFLTAAHCGGMNNSIFIFNYESASCSPSVDDKSVNSIAGSILRAYETSVNSSDFQLVELSTTPPDSFNVLYAGWSAKDVAPQTSTVIHHPSGDVKKITIDFDSAISATYYNDPSPYQNHWQVNKWDVGTTEGGSSGSPLFNEEHQVVGQLHGGMASCGSLYQDWFGKFSYSWDSDPAPAKQLKYWLDPDSTGILEMHAFDPDTPQFALDAEMLSIEGLPPYSCSNNHYISVILRNKGSDTLKSVKLKYKAGNQLTDSLVWNTSLTSMEIVKIPLGALTFPIGNFLFQVYIEEVNGAADLLNSNDTVMDEYQFVSNPREVYFTIKTDDYGTETSWTLKDSTNGKVLYEGGPYVDTIGGTVSRDTFCLYDSCFTFRINDALGDGFNDPSGQYGNGYYLVTDSAGDTLIFNDNFTSKFYEETFCLQLTGIDELQKNTVISIFPNPVKSRFTVRSEREIVEITLYSVQGQLVNKWVGKELQNKKNNLSKSITPGIYILTVYTKNGERYQEKLIIQ